MFQYIPNILDEKRNKKNMLKSKLTLPVLFSIHPSIQGAKITNPYFQYDSHSTKLTVHETQLASYIINVTI